METKKKKISHELTLLGRHRRPKFDFFSLWVSPVFLFRDSHGGFVVPRGWIPLRLRAVIRADGPKDWREEPSVAVDLLRIGLVADGRGKRRAKSEELGNRRVT